MSRIQTVTPRKLVAFRLMHSQIRMLDEAHKALEKSKTSILEEALAHYLTKLHIEGVI